MRQCAKLSAHAFIVCYAVDLGGKAAERIFFHLYTHKSYPGIRRGSKYFIVPAMVLIVAAFAVGKKIEDREGKKI